MIVFWLCFLFNNPKDWPQGITIKHFSISWNWGFSGSLRLIGRRRCIKEKLLNDIGFLIKELFPVEAIFVGEKGTSDEEKVVERGFLDKKVLDKEERWDRKSVFDTTSLLFWEF